MIKEVINSWDLSAIFESDEDYKKSFEAVFNDFGELLKFKGRLAESTKVLLEYIEKKQEVERKVVSLYTYASLKSDLNTKDSSNQSDRSKVNTLMSKFAQACSFDAPEIMSLDESYLKLAIESDEFSQYRHLLANIIRNKPHVLSEEAETIMAASSDFAGGFQNTYSLLTNADMVFEAAIDSKGESYEVTTSSYSSLMQSKDRELRKSAFKSIYKTYKSHINTIAALMEAEVKKNIFFARMRGFGSAREAAFFENNVPVSVQDKLINSLHKNMGLLHKSLELRKKVLGYEEMHMYDTSVSISKDEEKVPYELARETVLKAIEPMGDDYVNVVKHGFENRWLDVYPGDGKRSGAYSWGTYDSHPYILLNYNETQGDMFTLAHEFGHAMHSYLSNKNQNYFNSQYSIFVAEIASTTNEGLLNDYLVKNEKDFEKKKTILNNYIDRFRSVIFRQAMFAEFERDIHAHVENGGALSAEFMCEHYIELVRKYFGPNVCVDDEIRYEWARIPHMYYNFYVYQYATGMSAAVSLCSDILENGPKKALEFLSSGGSDYPINVMKRAGIDMESGEAVDSALKVFSKLLDEYEKIILSEGTIEN